MLLKTLLALSLFTGPRLARAEHPSGCGIELGGRARLDRRAELAVRDASERAASDALTRRGLGRRARGYAILIATMVASVSATTYLNSVLPPHAEFLRQFIGMASTIGIYIFGAPIWEPITSAVRQIAFGVEQTPAGRGAPRLLEQWYRTQRALGLNHQMSRNGLIACITSIKQNFYEAKRAIDGSDSAYAADQVAEAAVRLRRLYVDLEPDDADVTLAVRASFTNHVVIDHAFRREVLVRIHAFDADANSAEPSAHYAAVLDAWL